MEGIWRLVYLSRNRIGGPAAVRRAEVERILAAARRTNGRLGVTGALLFNRGCFAQALEGRQPAVEQVFERIQRDGRHAEVTVLDFAPVAARGFGAWSMAFAGEVEEDRLAFGDLAAPDEAARPPGAAAVLDLLTTLVRRKERAA